AADGGGRAAAPHRARLSPDAQGRPHAGRPRRRRPGAAPPYRRGARLPPGDAGAVVGAPTDSPTGGLSTSREGYPRYTPPPGPGNPLTPKARATARAA